MSVSVSGVSALEVGSPVPLCRARMLMGPLNPVGYRAQYAVNRDGSRFLLNVPVDDEPRQTMTVIEDWSALINRQLSQ